MCFWKNLWHFQNDTSQKNIVDVDLCPYTRGRPTKIDSQTVTILRLFPNISNMFVSLSHECQSDNQFISSVKAAEGSSQISIYKIDNRNLRSVCIFKVVPSSYLYLIVDTTRF